MADGILAAVNENGNIDRFIDTKGGVHYIEPKRYEESVAKIDAAAAKAKETVNSATEAVSECKAQTGACTQETARAKEIADTVESRITGIEGDVAALRDSVSQVRYTLESGGSSDVIKLSHNCSFADSNGYINLFVFGKLAYVYWRGLNLSGASAWVDGFTINKKLANDNAWVDAVISNGKSAISDCGFVSRDDTCVLTFTNTSSSAVKTSAFAVLELA